MSQWNWETHPNTVAMQEEMTRLRQEIALIELSSERYIKSRNEMMQERDDLRQLCRTIYEVWAGSEGIPEPQTCPEEYLYQLVCQMRDEAKKGL